MPSALPELNFSSRTISPFIIANSFIQRILVRKSAQGRIFCRRKLSKAIYFAVGAKLDWPLRDEKRNWILKCFKWTTVSWLIFVLTNFQRIYSYVYVTTSKSFFFVLRDRVTGFVNVSSFKATLCVYVYIGFRFPINLKIVHDYASGGACIVAW